MHSTNVNYGVSAQMGQFYVAVYTAEAGRLTPDRLARFVAGHDLPALVAVCEGSPCEQARHGAHQLRRLIRAGQAQVYQRVLPGLPVALADPFFRLDLARAAARAGLDLFPPPRPGG